MSQQDVEGRSHVVFDTFCLQNETEVLGELPPILTQPISGAVLEWGHSPRARAPPGPRGGQVFVRGVEDTAPSALRDHG